MASSLSSRKLSSPSFDTVEIFPHVDRLFGSVRKSSKGLAVTTLFHQLMCFFLDGTSRHLVRFDELREDEGYADAMVMDNDEAKVRPGYLEPTPDPHALGTRPKSAPLRLGVDVSFLLTLIGKPSPASGGR